MKRAKRPSKHVRLRSSVGSIAPNLHEGGRSEILADYLFSSWGTVSPVRRQDDHGVDLSCTLVERVGRRAWVRDYYSVQVKSTAEPWIFEGQESVRWLVEHPVPLFLCSVSKAQGRVRVYHVMPRFCVWAMGRLPTRLELVPEETHSGKFVEWQTGSVYSLSAPVIEADLQTLINEERMREFGQVLTAWVRIDRENCDLVRQGLLRFRMPTPYSTNEVPRRGVGEMGLATPDKEFLVRGLGRLAEAVQCIGGQRGQAGDRHFALQAALLLDCIQKAHPEAFIDNPSFRHRVPGQLGQIVTDGLNQALESLEGPPPTNYQYHGLERVETQLTELPLVKRFIES
jgi:hypothetical protein